MLRIVYFLIEIVIKWLCLPGEKRISSNTLFMFFYICHIAMKSLFKLKVHEFYLLRLEKVILKFIETQMVKGSQSTSE